jgi:hypothetical protein
MWSPWTFSDLQAGLSDPRITPASLFSEMRVCRFSFGEGGGVSWNGAILCLPSSFQAGCSGPSFHLQALCASGSAKVPGQASFLQFGSHLCRHPPRGHFAELQHVVDDMVS